MKQNSPCFGCQDRQTEPNCHNSSICQKWAEYTEMMDKDRAKKAAYDNSCREYVKYVHDVKTKLAKMKHRRGR